MGSQNFGDLSNVDHSFNPTEVNASFPNSKCFTSPENDASFSTLKNSKPTISENKIYSKFDLKTSFGTDFDPFRQAGQEKFFEEQVRLKKQLRDQMSLYAEKLSARSSNQSLEALHKKVSDLEEIMTEGGKDHSRPKSIHSMSGPLPSRIFNSL